MPLSAYLSDDRWGIRFIPTDVFEGGKQPCREPGRPDRAECFRNPADDGEDAVQAVRKCRDGARGDNVPKRFSPGVGQAV